MASTYIDRKKYGGKYIATKSFDDDEIIASGKNLSEVYDEAVKLGAVDPVINFVHEEGVVCLY